jgi:GNAT superfamily N-acetyltransferase
VSREPLAVEFRTVPADDPDFERLAAAMGAEIDDLYDYRGLGPIPGVASFSEHVRAPVVGYAEGTAVACGVVRHWDEETAEIKRMYVEPEVRGRQVARQLLVALEDAARALDYSRAVLDTGPSQPHAKALYESTGYRLIADYNHNPFAAYWFEKEL